jgi:Uma2 family endonuclease
MANNLSGPEQGHWTYKDYIQLPENGTRYEIMNGFLLMAPSPTWSHQNAAFEIASH